MADGLRPDLRAAVPALTGRIVPEAAAWRMRPVLAKLETLAPDVVILQTARAIRPELLDGPWVTVVDLVDRLSESYRQRAEIRSGWRRPLLRMLAGRHEKVERTLSRSEHRVVAAGWSDADAVGGEWFPIPVDRAEQVEVALERSSRAYDAVFSGTLSYEPNIDALRWFASEGPYDDLRVLVAGHRPTDEVRRLCAEQRWDLVEDYPDRQWLAAQAHVAIAPLRSTAGIQIKVLEAATIGMPQVVAPAALAGLAPGLPCVIADGPVAFAAAVRDLVADPQRRAQLGHASRAEMLSKYLAECWTASFEQLVGQLPAGVPTSHVVAAPVRTEAATGPVG